MLATAHSLMNILVMLDVGHILGCSTIPLMLAKNIPVMLDAGHITGCSAPM